MKVVRPILAALALAIAAACGNVNPVAPDVQADPGLIGSGNSIARGLIGSGN
jgi:hypothetical protein